MLLALLTLGAGGGVPRPRATVARNGALTVTLPAALLQSREIKQQLTSGLTTVFVLTVTASGDGGTVKGGARIDVRLDLWEEKYLVTVLDPGGQERKLTFAGDAALARWWSETPVPVTAPRRYGPRVDVEVKLKMLPFSSQEQSDTQRWLSRTLSQGRAPGGEFTPAQSAEILRIIVDTSVRRRPLLEYHWSLRASREAAR
jgi:hypothetical protein